MTYRRLFWIEHFLIAWALGAWWLNGYFLRLPWWGSFAHHVDDLHFVAYGVLGVWCATRKNPFYFVTFILWAFLDEYLQGFMPSRVSSWFDVLRNLVGLIAGYFSTAILFLP